jgi:hypothetical protein
MREAAAQQSLAFLDLEPLLPKDLAQFIDDVHWMPEGPSKSPKRSLMLLTGPNRRRAQTRPHRSFKY